MHPARGVEGAGQGLQPRRRRRLHRRRSDVRLPAREGAAVPHARRHEPGSAAGDARSVDHGRGESPGRRADGIQRQDVADRLQDRRAEPAARELLRLDRVRLLGVPPARRAPRRRPRARSRRGCIARARESQPMLPPEVVAAGFPRTGREIALQAPITEEQIRVAEGRRRRADLRPHVHRTRRRARAPDEARAARSICAAPCSITAARSW